MEKDTLGAHCLIYHRKSKEVPFTSKIPVFYRRVLLFYLPKRPEIFGFDGVTTLDFVMDPLSLPLLTIFQYTMKTRKVHQLSGGDPV